MRGVGNSLLCATRCVQVMTRRIHLSAMSTASKLLSPHLNIRCCVAHVLLFYAYRITTSSPLTAFITIITDCMQRYTASTQAFIRITSRPEASSIFFYESRAGDRLALYSSPMSFYFLFSSSSLPSFEIAGLRDSLLYDKAPCL